MLRTLAALFMLCLVAASCRSQSSPLQEVVLEAGMPRAEVEKRIAKALSKPNIYSPYGNNLEGGVARYKDGSLVLEVTYSRGSPAPIILDTEGRYISPPPVDETVINYRIFKERG